MRQGHSQNSQKYHLFGLGIREEIDAGADAEPHRFTGQELEPELGIYYMGARFYDPDLGRFLQVDPAREFWNSYSYVGNSPIMGLDPSGESTIGFELGQSWGFIFGLQYSLGVVMDDKGNMGFTLSHTKGAWLGATASPIDATLNYGLADEIFDLNGKTTNIGGSFNPFMEVIGIGGELVLSHNEHGVISISEEDSYVGAKVTASLSWGTPAEGHMVVEKTKVYGTTLFHDTGKWWGNKFFDWFIGQEDIEPEPVLLPNTKYED